jgi:hypothetical protein
MLKSGEIHQLQMGDIQVEHDVDARLAGGRGRGLGGKGQRHLVQRIGGEHLLIDSALSWRRVREIDGGGEIAGPRPRGHRERRTREEFLGGFAGGDEVAGSSHTGGSRQEQPLAESV